MFNMTQMNHKKIVHNTEYWDQPRYIAIYST